MRHQTACPDGETETTYAIHEVYYDEEKNVTNWTKEPASFISDTEDFGWHIERINAACEKPTLDFDTGKELARSES